MAQTKLWRQGDVMLTLIHGLPADALREKTEGDIILARGEATGHAHRITADTAELYTWQGDRLIEVKGKATALTHEEHTAITLEPGIYKVIQQLQYFPQAIQKVSD